MPQVRQPAALQKMALDAIFEHVVFCCDQISVEGSLNELKQVISAIKKVVISRMPWSLVAEFSARFLDRFYSDCRPASHLKAALKVIVDTEIVGLQCGGPILRYLAPKDGQRLRRLVKLNLCYTSRSLQKNLVTFQLNDLTCFEFAQRCTDSDLIVIGRNCPKLQVVRVPNSCQLVTDEGVLGLIQCSDLRSIDVDNCWVTDKGINHLLSVHKKLEKIEGVSMLDLFDLNSSVCPSITHCAFEYDDMTFAHLRKIVTKFPNIAYLHLASIYTEDLSILKSLKKLTGIELPGIYDESGWDDIKDLLTFNGSNLTTLRLNWWSYEFEWQQDMVDFIFDACPNLECFKFDYGEGHIVIPSFQKLKALTVNATESWLFQIINDAMLEFDKLPNLETLSFNKLRLEPETVESIMLNNDKFPKLSLIETESMLQRDVENLRQIARMKNLNFEIKNDFERNCFLSLNLLE